MLGSIPRFLAAAAERLPEKAAIVSSARSVAFAHLHQEALATAACLREFGIQDPDGHVWEIAYNPYWTVTEDGRTLLGDGRG